MAKNMDRFDKFINKGNDIVDRAEAKAKQRQAMSDDPESEKQGMTAKDMAGATMEYGKDTLKDAAKEKFENKFLGKNADNALEGKQLDNLKAPDGTPVDKQNPNINKNDDPSNPDTTKDMQDKYLNKDADQALQEGKEANKLPEKSDTDNMKDKFLDRKSDNLLNNDSNGAKGRGNTPNNNGGNKSNSGNKGNNGNKFAGGNQSGGDKGGGINPFGDTKGKDSKGNAGGLFGKNPKAGADAANVGKGLAKEGMKEGLKEGAKQGASKASPAGDAVGAAQKIKNGDMDGAVDDGAAFVAGKVAGYYGGPVADKAASFATKAFLKTEAGKLLKGCCCMMCLGVVGLLIGAIMFLPMLIVFIMKKVAEILETIENIPLIGEFAGFIKDKIYEALGLSDFELEDIGQDTNKLHGYADIKQNFYDAHPEINKWKEEEQVGAIMYSYESGEPHDPPYEEFDYGTFDPDPIVSECLPLFKIFAGLETVKKDSISADLENYFLREAVFEFDIKYDLIVERENVQREVVDPDTGDVEYVDDVLIKVTSKPKLVPVKATTLTDILTYEGKYIDDNGNEVDENYMDGNRTWVQTNVKSEINTEVISIFNQESWTRSEISSFEYIAECNPIDLIYDAGVYGFNSSFQMPIENTVIAVPYDAATHPYIEVNGDEDTEVLAAAEGVVQNVTTDADGLYSVSLLIGNGSNQHIITYSKLKTSFLTNGTTVVKSQPIGHMSNVNLNVEVKTKAGETIDPNVFLSSTYTSAKIHEEDIGKYSMNSYKQGDYGIVGGVSMKDAACGPTSLAMVLSSDTCGNQTVSPTTVASLARQKGLWSSVGASWSMFKELESYYGYRVSQYTIHPKGYATNGQASPNISTVINAISSRKPVIILIHGERYGYSSKFTKGGHFIVVDGFIEGQNNVARILDPASTAEERKYATLSELFSGAVQAYVFN